MSEEMEKVEIKKKPLLKKMLMLTTIILLLLLIAGYFLKVQFYRRHFLPGTRINTVQCDKMVPTAAISLLEKDRETYSVEIYGRTDTGEEKLLGVLNADQIGLKYTNTKSSVEEVFAKQNPYGWIGAYFSDSVFVEFVPEYQFDREKLKKALYELEAFRQSGDHPPRDAYIKGYYESTKKYEMENEYLGTSFDKEKAYRYIVKQLENGITSISLNQSTCYHNPEVKSNDRRLTRVTDQLNKWLSASISYDWHGNEVVVDADMIHQWVGIENGQAVLDESAVLSFLQETAEKWDTYGTRRTFETQLGVSLSLKAKKYGWKTDPNAELPLLLEAIYSGEQVAKEPVYAEMAYQKGSDDIGTSYVEADLSNQHLYLIQDGEVLLETDFVSGNMSSTPDCVTPEGIFGLTYKKSPAVLRGADYSTPVNYWMPFYRNYGMHDATWRRNFGGDIYLTNGSHGCINLPKKAAKKIYEAVEKGFPVITYYYPEGKNPLEESTVTVDEEAAPTEGELQPTLPEMV